jgi:hypothetical protein
VNAHLFLEPFDELALCIQFRTLPSNLQALSFAQNGTDAGLADNDTGLNAPLTCNSPNPTEVFGKTG